MAIAEEAMNWPQAPDKRNWWQAIRHGLAGRCPHCGEGRLFGRFLKVEAQCSACGQAFDHHRADDLPPYLVITIVGHIVVTGMLLAETAYEWPAWLHMALWPTLTLVLSLALIQPIKGAVVGHQWALRMHGFGDDADTEAALRPHVEEIAR